MGENIRLLFEIIDNNVEKKKTGLTFFSCFKEAFDSIDPTYIINCLEHFNFGEDFIKWVKLLYNKLKAYSTMMLKAYSTMMLKAYSTMMLKAISTMTLKVVSQTMVTYLTFPHSSRRLPGRSPFH